MTVGNLKLGVDVVSAHNLLPKYGQGSSSAFVELCFDGQRYRSTTKEKDLSPVWNETFYFNISDPAILHSLVLDAYVYNNVRGIQSRTFIGKVTINGTSFVPYPDAVVLHYPLEKHGIFSRVRGELGLKVYISDDPSIKSSAPVSMAEESHLLSESGHRPISSSGHHHAKHEAARHTFHSIPKHVDTEEQTSLTGEPHHVTKYMGDEMKAPEPMPPKLVHMHSVSSRQPVDFALKETSPFLGGGRVVGGKVIRTDRAAVGTYDLVEKMHFLFVRVVKARELPAMDDTGSLDPFVEVRIGNYKGITRHIEKQQHPLWNVVFAFSRERMQASVLEVVKDKDLLKDDLLVWSEWYRLEDKKGEKIKGELMLAVWIGTQADEAFPDAWHSDAATPIDSSAAASALIRSKVYHAPRLWYVRVNVVEAQDLVPTERSRFPDVYVKAHIGSQVMRTKPTQARNFNPVWNEDLFFVAAEPFEDDLVLTRADDRIIHSRWFNLEKPVLVDVDQLDMLRHQAVNIVATRLGRAEPPLRREVVEYMSDVDSPMEHAEEQGELLPPDVRLQRAIRCREMPILPTVFLYMFLIGIWNFRYRPRYLPHMNTKLSQAEAVHPDELDEEFDTFPTSRNPDLKKQRKSEANELGFFEKIMVKVPAAIFMLAFIYIWSSSTTILSADIVHLCHPWHLPEDWGKYSVFIDKEEVRNKNVNVVDRLMKISAKERENMRRYIVYELLPGLVYGDFDSKFVKFQDAFSISVNSLLERATRLNDL
ncbi:hypothetical protein SASPL_153507 [Salvia splendens]|uniref:C2 domain-containing protein n=1 Tax=Salvia splendens TaxID=180675 RepID=A0A8X8W4Y4_SALSN|nr:hypothetical protein SASPL_153507 [Salvia splendens]